MKQQTEMFPPPESDAVDAPAEPRISRDQHRSRRKREVRAKTVSVKRMTKRELAIGKALYPEDEHADIARPKTRADCKDGFRPCPFVSCRHHLYLDVSARTGAIKLNFPDVEADALETLPESCALDVAERDGSTLEEVGAIMNLTRERIRQLEVKALAKLQARHEMLALRDYVDAGPVGKRRLPVIESDDEDREDEHKANDDDASDDDAGFDVDSFASDALDGE